MSHRFTSVYCPYCHQHTSLALAPSDGVLRDGSIPRAVWRTDRDDVWWIGLCNFCLKPMLVLNDGVTVHPTPSPTPTDPNIPDAIRADLDEAKRCFQVGAWRAVAVMARRAIQATAIDKGATKGNLVDQINALATKGVITNDVKEWATVVRWVGNDGAHPGSDAVTKDDAEDILDLTEQLLTIVYVAPAIAAARRATRGK